MPEALKITLAQINPTVGALEENTRKILDIWQNAESDLVVFPEMVVCAYPPEDLVLKPSFLDEIDLSVEKLCNASKNFTPAALISCPWRINGQTYNAALLIENGQISHIQTKHHLPNYGVFDEQRIFKSGPLPKPINFKGTQIGLLICEDMWYPDVTAHLKGQGAQLLLSINASPFETTKDETRLDIAKARIAETGLPLLYVNQVGGQDEIVFDGGSFIMDEQQTLRFQGHEFTEGVYDFALTKEGEQWDIDGDESIPAYSDDEELYQALLLGLRDYVEKNGFPGVLLGSSGGIDSALSAVIAADALGPENVRCVMMPSRYTSQDSSTMRKPLPKTSAVPMKSFQSKSL